MDLPWYATAATRPPTSTSIGIFVRLAGTCNLASSPVAGPTPDPHNVMVPPGLAGFVGLSGFPAASKAAAGPVPAPLSVKIPHALWTTSIGAVPVCPLLVTAKGPAPTFELDGRNAPICLGVTK